MFKSAQAISKFGFTLPFSRFIGFFRPKNASLARSFFCFFLHQMLKTSRERERKLNNSRKLSFVIDSLALLRIHFLTFHFSLLHSSLFLLHLVLLLFGVNVHSKFKCYFALWLIKSQVKLFFTANKNHLAQVVRYKNWVKKNNIYINQSSRTQLSAFWCFVCYTFTKIFVNTLQMVKQMCPNFIFNFTRSKSWSHLHLIFSFCPKSELWWITLIQNNYLQVVNGWHTVQLPFAEFYNFVWWKRWHI